VSNSEAGDLGQELAWVRDQKASDAFIYTPFQRFTDGVAAATKLSSLDGKGTFNGDFISKPNPPFRGKDCATAECVAGIPPLRGHTQPDYVSVQGSIYIASGGFAVNLHNGKMFGQVSVGRTYPGYTTQLGGSIMFGKIVGGGTADSTSEFLKGGSAQGIIVFPVIPFVGAGGGVNYSYGGTTSVEYGIGTPGASTSPAGYGYEVKK
jgi:filamentous hemagglutinin